MLQMDWGVNRSICEWQISPHLATTGIKKYHPKHGANQKVRTTKYWLAEPFLHALSPIYEYRTSARILGETDPKWLHAESSFARGRQYHHADWLLNSDPPEEASQLCPLCALSLCAVATSAALTSERPDLLPSWLGCD